MTPAVGSLATNVAAVKFDFSISTFENGYCGYSEITLFGMATPLPVATNPTNIMVQFTDGSLKLGWPANHISWCLQVQTNNVAVGLSKNWFDVAGTNSTNQYTIPISQAIGGVFYRLIFP